MPFRSSRESGIVIAVVGLVLLILGGIRWNSVASYWARSFAGSDGLGILLFLGGFACFVLGLHLIASGQVNPSSSPPTDPSQAHTTMPSAEARIRRLADLRSKGLITETEFDEKKRDIINSL